MSAATFAAHDQLLTAAYSAAVTLIAAIVDPAALEAAPLRHRATALNAVSTLIGRLHKAKPSPLEGVTHIEWDFGEDDDDGAPLVDPHLHMQHDSLEAATFGYGLPSYLSHDLHGEIVPAVFKPGDNRTPSGKFRQEWPAYATLLERIGENADMDRIRQEVVDYIVAVEEGRVQGP